MSKTPWMAFLVLVTDPSPGNPRVSPAGWNQGNGILKNFLDGSNKVPNSSSPKPAKTWTWPSAPERQPRRSRARHSTPVMMAVITKRVDSSIRSDMA